MTPQLNQWALKWGISYAALAELRLLFGVDVRLDPIPSKPEASESFVQSLVRLEAARKGLRLFRNNVGALEDSRGVPVRYGLGNDSAHVNKVLKSGDLIGWRPVNIGPEHVGLKLAQFVSRECKRPDWKFTGTDHENAQLKWAQILLADGGDACFVQGEGSFS